jgi:hypothetical protein
MTSYVLMQTTGIDNSLESPCLGSEAFVAFSIACIDKLFLARPGTRRKKKKRAAKQKKQASNVLPVQVKNGTKSIILN